MEPIMELSGPERGDTEAVVALLADDAWVTMPPYPVG
jgi:hypothetical protein